MASSKGASTYKCKSICQNKKKLEEERLTCYSEALCLKILTAQGPLMFGGLLVSGIFCVRGQKQSPPSLQHEQEAL